MGERIIGKYRIIYGKAASVLSDWDSTQELTLALLSSATNIITRLPALSQESNYGKLESIPGFAQTLLAKQTYTLETTLQRLHAQLAELLQCCNQLEKLVESGRQLLQGINPAPPPTSASVRRGANPSLSECQEGLEDLWRMHRDEWAIKKVLVATVTWDSKEEELNQVQAIFRAQPNIDPVTVRTIQMTLQPLE